MSLYSISATATYSAISQQGVVYTSTASASASSLISIQDAFNIAYTLATNLAIVQASTLAGLPVSITPNNGSTTSTTPTTTNEGTTGGSNGGSKNRDNSQVVTTSPGFNLNDEMVDIGNDLNITGDFNLTVNINSTK